MMNLNPIQTEDEEFLRRAFQEANLDLPDDLATEIWSRIALYRGSIPTLRFFPRASQVIQGRTDQLEGLYTTPRQTVKALLDQIRGRASLSCPYCGRMSGPSHLDHFVPKRKYPEFSIFALNLVPCCPNCNQIKSTRLWKNGNRLFLNPYIDTFMARSFYFVTISPPYDGPEFDILYNRDVMTPAELDICRSHFNELGIIDLLLQYFVSKYRAILAEFSIQQGLTARNVVEQLTAREIAHSALFGCNAWESVLLRAILDNTDVISHIVSVQGTMPLGAGI